jgi:hypothetical protein
MGRPSKYTHDNDENIEQKYRGGASLSSLSKEYDIPVMTIKRRLIKRGVEIRNLSTAMKLISEKGGSGRSVSSENKSRNVAFGVQFDDSNNPNKSTSDDEWIS